MAREEFLRALITARQSVDRAMEAAAEGIRDAAHAALEGAAAMDAYEGRVEEAGEEARETTIENLGLATSLRAVAAAAGEASVNVGPFNTSVRRAIVALPALIGLVGSLATVLGGLTVAVGGAAGALAALFAGGLIGRAQELALRSSDIEGTMQGLQEIMLQFAESIDQVTQPLQTISSQDAAMEFLDNITTFVGDLARSAAELAPVLGQMAENLGATFWEEEARGIAQVEQTVKDLMPLLEALVGFILRQLPDLIAFLREETEEVGPAVADFAASLIPVIANLTEFSNVVLTLVLPPLTLLLDTIAVLLDLLNSVPRPILAAAGAFTIATAAAFLYSGSITVATGVTGALTAAVWGLIGAIGTLLAPISATALVIGAVVGAIIGLITWLGLWDDIANVLIVTWNTLLEIIEFLVNAQIAYSKALRSIIVGILDAIGVIDAMATAARILGDAIQFIIDGLQWLAQRASAILSPIVGDVNAIQGEINQRGGVDLTRFKAGQAETVRDRRRDRSVERRSQEIQRNRSVNNFDFSGASFGSGVSERDIERAVEKALDKKKSRTSDT